MNAQLEVSRREFLRISATAGAGLVLGFTLPGCREQPAPTETPESTPTPEPGSGAFEPNIYLRIGRDGLVTVTVPRSEMGQGVRTALPMIVAEELEVGWSAIRVEQADADSNYGDQTTGGSQSIQDTYQTLRFVSAAARTMLIASAAQTWGVDPSECTAENGAVTYGSSGERLAYADLVDLAATLPAPPTNEVILKDPSKFRVIGTSVGRIDNPQIVDGSVVYGIDVWVPDMLYAVVARCPVFGGKVSSFDKAPALAVEGVRDVVKIDTGVAVVADSTWAAIQGRQVLAITWDEGQNADLSTETIRQRVADRLPDPQSGNSDVLEAVYELPYLAHAALEPMNCVADVRADRCEVWAPTQNPGDARTLAANLTGLPATAVALHVTLIGGGFGRRLGVDYVREAVQISQAIGAPVKLVWTREDDIQHDLYHPLSSIHVKSSLSEIDPTVRLYEAPAGVPTGAWRAVTNVPEAFAHESFMDELAAAVGRDPYELRRELLADRPRAVLELAASKAGWGTPLPDGWGRGIAYHASWGVTHVAEVAEVSVAQDGGVRVQRVVCAVDCGIVINPDMVVAQMEGGIVFGLSAALKGEITIANGRAQQSNFHDYPVLRIDEVPTIEVYIVPSTEKPTGVGEMSGPPIAAAVANAVFAATGKRIRRLPIWPEDLRS